VFLPSGSHRGAGFVALALFPEVVQTMAGQLDWTTQLGEAFAADRSAVFASIQRLRAKARDTGTLKTTPQQEVETKTTSSGQQVIVIEPANPQVVYVPQYDSQVVYTPSATSSTVVIQEDDDDAEAAVAGLIGFTAGVAIGAAIDNNYYYGPYGWHGGAYMYNDAWTTGATTVRMPAKTGTTRARMPAKTTRTVGRTSRKSVASARARSRNSRQSGSRTDRTIPKRRPSESRGEATRKRRGQRRRARALRLTSPAERATGNARAASEAAFVVNQDGSVHETDLGPATGSKAQGITLYNPASSWKPVQ
jgi:hypothetical protein